MYSIYKQLFNEKKKLSVTQRFVFVVIIFSFFLIIIESEKSIKSINPYIFEYLNIFLSYFFLTEYSLRLMCCGYTKKYKGFLGKIRFIFSFHSLIDLISFVPSLIFPGLNETFLFRIFRIFRMLKIIKLSNQLPAIKNVTQVLSKRKNEIFFSLFITIFIILIASIVLYLAEGKAQPEAFGSIIRSFWWSTITLTTIGYGDVYPITILGKIATTIIAIAGIGIVALPAGIIAGSFSEIVNKKKTMSPIFENKKIILGNAQKESGKIFDVTIGILFALLSTPLVTTTLLSLLLFPLGIFVGFYGPIGRSFKDSFLNNFDQTYNSISLEAAKMSKKKDLTSKEVDKRVNELVTESFDYEEVLDVIGFVEDTLNHKAYLKKKVKYLVPDTKVTLKAGEILYFRTHTIWAQGSPDNNVVKDIGYFYLSNKRFIFIGEYNSHSITLSRIVNFEIGNNYALICKTAGKNEIFEINKLESLSYLKFLYEKLT